MGRAARQKAERQSTADYLATQPLFDALRIAFVKFNDQRAELSIAKDIVQHVNVSKTPNETAPAQEAKYQRSINCAVKAWRVATDIYANIFAALADVSKKDEMHGSFVEIAETAARAKSAAYGFKLYERADGGVEQAETAARKMPRVEDEDEHDDSSNSSSDDSDNSEAKPPIDITPTNPTLLHLLGQGAHPAEVRNSDAHSQSQQASNKIKYDSKGHKILWKKGAEKPLVPYATLSGGQKKEWQAEKRRQRREKKAAKRATIRAAGGKQAKGATTQEDLSKPLNERDFISLNGTAEAHPNTTHIVPKVEYEDISDEVEARLKLKEEEKLARKKEKKRKRESGESFLGDVSGEGKAEKPRKKKSRAGDTDEAAGPSTVEEVRTAKHARNGDEGVEAEAEGRKKRKKVKS